MMIDSSVSMDRPAPDAMMIPPSLFGQNLEHTRSCIANGLSAQLLHNRKFCGKPSPDGVAAAWQPFGTDVYFELPQHGAFVHHAEGSCRNMLRRNELSRQLITHVSENGFAGIVQKNIPLMPKKYIFRIALRDPRQSCGKVRMEFRNGESLLAGFDAELASADWVVREFEFSSPCNVDADLYIGLTARGSVSLGMVSLLPEDHWHGMRPDVMERLQEIGTTLIRWPGGNFAGEYRWRDGLLPADERAPSQAATEIETQPYTNGFDDNELGTDEIMALCRRIGAEPYFTINAMWDSPEESAAWVEYCNGTADTPMGKIRAERGFPEPFDVRFWSLGNEMGFAHMEGTKAPEEYAKIVSAHGRAMKQVSPEITLCSSGPLPNEAWEKYATTPLAGLAPVASFHHYVDYSGEAHLDFAAPETLEACFGKRLQELEVIGGRLAEMCRFMPETVAVSFDEWNLWYAWYRQTGPLDGLWCGVFLHWLLRVFRRYRIGCCCFFQPVNEGAVKVHPRGSSLTAMGQAMQLMAQHAGGEVLPFPDEHCFATRHADGSIYVTVVNTDFHRPLKLALPFAKKDMTVTRLQNACLLPGEVFSMEMVQTAVPAEITAAPLSILALRIR